MKNKKQTNERNETMKNNETKKLHTLVSYDKKGNLVEWLTERITRSEACERNFDYAAEGRDLHWETLVTYAK